MNNEKNGKSAIGSIIGGLVLVAASVTGGWIACELWPKPKQAKAVNRKPMHSC